MKHSKRLMKCVMAGALCVAMTMPVLADTKADVTNQINTLESQASDLESELSSMKANKTSLESYIAELDTKMRLSRRMKRLPLPRRISRKLKRIKRHSMMR